MLDYKWWPEAESNRRHADFQSAALPTELSGPREGRIKAATEASVKPIASLASSFLSLRVQLLAYLLLFCSTSASASAMTRYAATTQG